MPGGTITREPGCRVLRSSDGDHELEVRFYDTGRQEWRRDGVHHRKGGPAIVMPDGERHYYLAGELVRVVRPDGRDSSPAAKGSPEQERAWRRAARDSEIRELWAEESVVRSKSAAPHRRPKT